MVDNQTSPMGSNRTLRLWPGVAIVAVQWIVRFVVPIFFPDALQISVFGGLLGGLVFGVWWLFFSRACWTERIGLLALSILAIIGVSLFVDESIATAMMGMMLVVYSVPVLCLALIVWAVATRDWPKGLRRTTLVGTILIASGGWLLLRTGGFNSEMRHDFAWRWSETREEKLLASANDEVLRVTAGHLELDTDIEWPGFRGAKRDGIVSGSRIETDWAKSPPVELWRREVGPGWSSFSVRNGIFFTQEQLGEEEVVTCYRLDSGEIVWRHSDQARFWESNAGAGPRATPTVEGERVFAFGATGILNALAASDGAQIWSRNVSDDAGIAVPGWAFASSPLVLGGKVIVAAAGKLAAYEISTGEPTWFGPDGIDGYSSPHLMEIDGVEQIVLASKSGAVGVDPADGAILWNYDRPGGSRIVQPALTDGGDLLLSRGERGGLNRLEIRRKSVGWTIEEKWFSNQLKPYFSDFVVRENHAFGFDGSSLVCLDTITGKRTEKGGRYGSGQLVLLEDQGLLLILSESGELALVEANPVNLRERTRISILEGKTWNHPVLVGDVLLVRNDHEMAAYRMANPDS